MFCVFDNFSLILSMKVSVQTAHLGVHPRIKHDHIYET